MLTLNTAGEFVSIIDGAETQLGIVATCKRGRWQYRDKDTNALYASGMTPDRFAARFWFRNDYTPSAN